MVPCTIRTSQIKVVYQRVGFQLPSIIFLGVRVLNADDALDSLDNHLKIEGESSLYRVWFVISLTVNIKKRSIL